MKTQKQIWEEWMRQRREPEPGLQVVEEIDQPRLSDYDRYMLSLPAQAINNMLQVPASSTDKIDWN